MNEVLHHIRKAFIDRLTGNITVDGITVPVVNVVPSNADFPYVKVYSVSNDEDDLNRSSFNTEAVIRLEVVTRFDYNVGGELQANLITDAILNQIRTRSEGYIDLTAQGWNVYVIQNGGVKYITDNLEDHTFYRSIISIRVKAEKI